MFHVVGGVRQGGSQVDQLAVLIYIEGIFNPNAQFFLRDVNAGLDGKHHARDERNVVVVGVVDIQANVMT